MWESEHASSVYSHGDEEVRDEEILVLVVLDPDDHLPFLRGRRRRLVVVADGVSELKMGLGKKETLQFYLGGRGGDALRLADL